MSFIVLSSCSKSCSVNVGPNPGPIADQIQVTSLAAIGTVKVTVVGTSNGCNTGFKDESTHNKVTSGATIDINTPIKGNFSIEVEVTSNFPDATYCPASTNCVLGERPVFKNIKSTYSYSTGVNRTTKMTPTPNILALGTIVGTADDCLCP